MRSRITEGQEQLLTHVARYRVTTLEAVRAQFFAPDQYDAAQKAARRLVEAGLLQRFTVAGRNFYQLTPAGAARAGAPRGAALRLGTQALRQRYALLAFCLLGPRRRQLFTPAEFVAAYPALAQAPGIDPAAQFYYLARLKSGERLARAVVDANAQPLRVVRKCREIAQQAAATPALAPMLDQFLLTVLVARPTKQETLVELFRTADPPLPVAVRIEVVPELAHLPAGEGGGESDGE